jgi:hypothetical protein
MLAMQLSSLLGLQASVILTARLLAGSGTVADTTASLLWTVVVEVVARFSSEACHLATNIACCETYQRLALRIADRKARC